MKAENHERDSQVQLPWIAAAVIGALNGLGILLACSFAMVMIFLPAGPVPEPIGRWLTLVHVVISFSYTGYISAARAGTRVLTSALLGWVFFLLFIWAGRLVLIAAKPLVLRDYPDVFSPAIILIEAVLLLVSAAIGYLLYSSERRHREHRLDPWNVRLLMIRLELALGGVLLLVIGTFVFCLCAAALTFWGYLCVFHLLGIIDGGFSATLVGFGIAKSTEIIQQARGRFGVLLADPRKATVILLRSFRDDRITVAEDRNTRRLGVFDMRGGEPQVALDSLLTQVASRAGRCVSVGDPLESLPHAGLRRVYYTDAEWKDRVETLLRRVDRILIIPSDSDGLNWELEFVRESGLLGKVILVFPPDTGDAKQHRWKRFRERMGFKAWEQFDEQITARAMAVSFPDDSEPGIVQSPKDFSAKAYEAALGPLLVKPRPYPWLPV